MLNYIGVISIHGCESWNGVPRKKFSNVMHGIHCYLWYWNETFHFYWRTNCSQIVLYLRLKIQLSIFELDWRKSLSDMLLNFSNSYKFLDFQKISAWTNIPFLAKRLLFSQAIARCTQQNPISALPFPHLYADCLPEMGVHNPRANSKMRKNYESVYVDTRSCQFLEAPCIYLRNLSLFSHKRLHILNKFLLVKEMFCPMYS